MKRDTSDLLIRRILAVALATLQLLAYGPGELLGAEIAAYQKNAAAAGAINRSAPVVQPVAAFPMLSDPPTDSEILRARVFEEPLVPMGAATSADENRHLAAALLSHVNSGNSEDLSTLETFLTTHPQSAWRPSLLTNMGIVYRRTGYYGKALKAWEEAWNRSKEETSFAPRAIADRAVAEWAELNARLGRFDVLKWIFQEIETREIGGSSGEKLQNAREGLWLMENRPQDAFRCGPMALDRILAFEKSDYQRDSRLINSQSTKLGMSLAGVMKLGNSLGMNLQMAQRTPGAALLLPAVIHWKAGHFAALLKEADGRFLVQDPTFGDELWVSRKALEEEGSGFFLVRAGELPEGWKTVDAAIGENVWGKGNTGTNDAQRIKKTDLKAGCSSGSNLPMAQYDIHLMMVNLTIWDTPVGYVPPRGPAVLFEVTYNHRESFQPSVFSYSNMGPQWTFDWVSYIKDDPSNLNASVYVYARGGGEETYSGFNTTTQSYAPSVQNSTVIVRTATSPIRYERRHLDGSVEVFAQADGAAAFPRRVFMTAWRDASGNTVEFSYDANLRMTAVTDAIGQVTTLDYELAQDPLKVTRVTDPFGRYARFDYDTRGRLVRITDIIGIQSSFTYSSGTFITYASSGTQRWLDVTDPTGATERVEFRHNAPGVAAIDPAYPTSILTEGFLQYRNSFFWDKRAWASYPGDYTKATIYHWLHALDFNATSGVPSAIKKPLESRVWLQYPGQTEAVSVSGITTEQPYKIARLLDDGTTQLYQYTYNGAGKLTKATDPLNRETVFVYGTNNTPDSNPAAGTGIDLLEVRQKNGASYDTLRSFTYDSAHHPLTSTDAARQTTTFTYRLTGDLETIVTPPRASLTNAQRTTTLSYLPDNASLGAARLLRIDGPLSGDTTSFTYDARGRVRTVTGSDGYALTSDYDDADRPTRRTYLDGTYEEMVYSSLDLARARDRQNRWTHFFYDANRRLISTRDSLGRTTQQEWCACGALSKLTDASGNVTAWTHDDQNRVTKETRADNSETLFTYENTTSRLKRRTDPLGQNTDYSYFKDNTVQQVSYPNPIRPTSGVSFTYDNSYNRVASMVDGIGTTTYAYYPVTSAGTLGATQLSSIDGPLYNDTIAYTYDELGRTISRSINNVSSSQSYDALGRINTVTNALGSFIYDYLDQTSHLSSVVYPNGQTTSYSYYGNLADRRLQQIHHQSARAGTISKFAYAYDGVGNIAAWTQQRDDAGSAVVRTYDFTYDSGDQLVSASYRTTDATPVLKRYAYTYDPAGNRTAEQVDDDVRQAGYNVMNRMTSQGPGGALSFSGTLNEAAMVTIAGKPAIVAADNTFSGKATVPPGTSNVDIAAKDYAGNQRTSTYAVNQSASARTFTYDANGNTVSDGLRTFEWDAENRLLAVQAGTHRSEFTYDGQSRRVRIVEKDNGSTTSDTVFLWCGLEICEERDSTGTTTKRFFPQGEQQSSRALFYTRDHLGSIRELTDSTQSVVARYDYDPYGRRTKLSGSGDTAFGFTGHFNHSATGLALTPFRAYDPEIGRWISADPLGLNGGQLNLYSYVANQPIQGFDQYGLYNGYDLAADTANLSAGALDAMLFGLGSFIKDNYSGGDIIRTCSGAYRLGWWGGTILPLAATAVETVSASAAAKAGAVAARNGTVIIGENMARVESYASSIGAETFEGTGMEANRLWIQEAKSAGKKIVDIGPDFARRVDRLKQELRPDSLFYNMERFEAKGYAHYFKAFIRTGKYEGSSIWMD